MPRHRKNRNAKGATAATPSSRPGTVDTLRVIDTGKVKSKSLHLNSLLTLALRKRQALDHDKIHRYLKLGLLSNTKLDIHEVMKPVSDEPSNNPMLIDTQDEKWSKQVNTGEPGAIIVELDYQDDKWNVSSPSYTDSNYLMDEYRVQREEDQNETIENDQTNYYNKIHPDRQYLVLKLSGSAEAMPQVDLLLDDTNNIFLVPDPETNSEDVHAPVSHHLTLLSSYTNDLRTFYKRIYDISTSSDGDEKSPTDGKISLSSERDFLLSYCLIQGDRIIDGYTSLVEGLFKSSDYNIVVKSILTKLHVYRREKLFAPKSKTVSKLEWPLLKQSTFDCFIQENGVGSETVEKTDLPELSASLYDAFKRIVFYINSLKMNNKIFKTKNDNARQVKSIYPGVTHDIEGTTGKRKHNAKLIIREKDEVKTQLESLVQCFGVLCHQLNDLTSRHQEEGKREELDVAGNLFTDFMRVADEVIEVLASERKDNLEFNPTAAFEGVMMQAYMSFLKRFWGKIPVPGAPPLTEKTTNDYKVTIMKDLNLIFRVRTQFPPISEAFNDSEITEKWSAGFSESELVVYLFHYMLQSTVFLKNNGRYN